MISSEHTASVPLWKNGLFLTWFGLIFNFVFAALSYFGDVAPGSYTIPALVPFGGTFFFLSFIALAIGVWGSVLLLKKKHRSLWWLLALLPTPIGATETVFFLVPILLKDKSGE